MLAVLRQRNFSLLWFGSVLSIIGDYFLFVALPFFVYEQTGSTLATGTMFAAQTLPRLLRRDFKVTTLFAIISIAHVGEGVALVLPIIFFKDVLGGGAAEFSYWIAGYGVGCILGGLLLGWFGGVINETRLFALSLIANGILLVAIFNTSWLPLIVALSVLAGITVIGWFIVAQTLLQKWVPDRYRGRVFGAYEATQVLMMLVGMGLAVALEDLLGVVVVLSLVGCVWALAGLVSWVMLAAEK
jgi:MFS family permease